MQRSILSYVRPVSLGAAFALVVACGGGGGGSSSSNAPIGPSGGWQGAHLTESSTVFDAWYPSVAMDGTGRAFVTWFQGSSAPYSVWGNAYAPASGGWQGDGTLSPAINGAQTPAVALNASGVGMIVWVENDGTQNRIYGMTYQTGVAGTFGSQTLISTTPAGAISPSIAVNASGGAAAAWLQWDGTHYHTWACAYTTAGGWGTPTQLETTTDESFTPVAAIDDSGNATVVWQRAADPANRPYTIWAARYLSGAWSASPTQLHSGSGDTGEPTVAMGASGAVAAWTESLDGGITFQIHVSRWTAGTDVWSAPVRVSPTSEFADIPKLAMDGNGNILMAWEQTLGGPSASVLNVAGSLYSPASGWSTPRRLDNMAGGVGQLSVAMNASGSANVVWNQDDGSRASIVGLRYAPSGGWSQPTLLETDQNGNAYAPVVSVGANGEAMAAWYQKDANGLRHVYTNRFH